MASPEKALYVPNMPDQSLRSEALDQAVRLSITASSWNTPGIVGAAKAFYEFLTEETETK